jgi:hypothetical protein
MCNILNEKQVEIYKQKRKEAIGNFLLDEEADCLGGD